MNITDAYDLLLDYVASLPTEYPYYAICHPQAAQFELSNADLYWDEAYPWETECEELSIAAKTLYSIRNLLDRTAPKGNVYPHKQKAVWWLEYA